MIKFLAAIAVVVLVASPAATQTVAQSWVPNVGTGDLVPPPYGENPNGSRIYQTDGTGSEARAQAPRGKTKASPKKMSRDPDVVTDEAGNVERDPDINIRSQIRRENNED